jgi:hypothetical protein
MSANHRPGGFPGRLLLGKDKPKLEAQRRYLHSPLDLVGGRDTRRRSGGLPSIDCSNCTYFAGTTQEWCVLRPEGTDCSPWMPFNNNFKRERIILWHQCPEGVSIYCGGWVDAQCCNNSGTQPTCEGGGAVYRCAEK